MAKYRKETISQSKRDALSRMYYAMYAKPEDVPLSNTHTLTNGVPDLMPAKKSPTNGIVAVEPRSGVASVVKYVDAKGVEQTLDLSKVKNLGDTAYAESQGLFPNAKECFIPGKDDILATNGDISRLPQFDSLGRESVLAVPHVVTEVTHMTKGDYGPYFMVHGYSPELGEIKYLSKGEIINEALASMSGIDLATGNRVSMGELPVWCAIEFVRGGKNGGYFVISPAQLELPTP